MADVFSEEIVATLFGIVFAIPFLLVFIYELNKKNKLLKNLEGRYDLIKKKKDRSS